MRYVTEAKQDGPEEVVVIVENDEGKTQPQTFQLCPLGLQYYSDRPVDEFELMEFDLKVDESDPKSEENIRCIGAVVRCQEVNETDGKYRVWIKFLDAPDQTCEQLRCAARKGKHLCCFCENF